MIFFGVIFFPGGGGRILKEKNAPRKGGLFFKVLPGTFCVGPFLFTMFLFPGGFPPDFVWETGFTRPLGGSWNPFPRKRIRPRRRGVHGREEGGKRAQIQQSAFSPVVGAGSL
eukprot:FR740091.1.p3 GENE.FR740091.1~~FR740091.1.p3  ORF type:complete len:113 (-),score=34.21 FR740091.1:867-1205(-)